MEHVPNGEGAHTDACGTLKYVSAVSLLLIYQGWVRSLSTDPPPLPWFSIRSQGGGNGGGGEGGEEGEDDRRLG